MIGQFLIDRERARTAGDPWAELCVLASLDGTWPRLRILVLRDLAGGLGVFYSGHSSKAIQLAQSPHTELLTYWDSIKVQYRLSVKLAPLSRDIIETHWPRRPPVSKALDWLYETVPQGSVIDADTSLEELLAQNISKNISKNMAKSLPPPGATGAMIEVISLERLELQPDGKHVRERFDQTTGAHQTLVP